VTKRIIKTGHDLGKPGRPFFVNVTVTAFFAPEDPAGKKVRKLEDDIIDK
jgi:hypothetical protein